MAEKEEKVRIIDDKGRVFGKINIIDLFALICLIGIVPVFIFGYKVYTRQPEPGQNPITIEAQLREQVKELSDKLAKEVQWRQKVVKEHPRLKKYWGE